MSRDDEVCDVESSDDGTSDEESKKPKPIEIQSFEQFKKDPGLFSTSFEDYLSYLQLCIDPKKSENDKAQEFLLLNEMKDMLRLFQK